MKIVIVGERKNGLYLTRHLSEEGHDVTVYDHNARDFGGARGTSSTWPVCEGMASGLAVLAEAGADECDLLIAVTSRDEVNIICCMLARKLGARHTIARVRNPEYAKSLFFIREELGLSMLINPEMDAATEIFRLLRFPTALKIDFLAKGRVELLTFRLTADSPLAGKALHALKSRVLVCTVQRDGAVYIPDGICAARRRHDSVTPLRRMSPRFSHNGHPGAEDQICDDRRRRKNQLLSCPPAL